MSLIYRPNKQYMTPNNIAINPAVTNNFEAIISGTTCIAYRFSVFDTDNNKITPPSSNRVNLSPTLYNDDTLSIAVSGGILVAGNTYKWQVEVYANDLTVSSIDTGTEILTVNNHNLNTGDIIYIQSTGTLPGGTSAFTIYYVRKLSTNTLALYETYEAALLNGTKLNITSSGTGTITISNIAISEQVLFTAYSLPTLTLAGGAISSQTYEFIPTYTQTQGIAINNFIAYLYDSNSVELKNSDDVFSSNIRYTFDGLISGNTYKVQFIATNLAGQIIDTGLISYTVSYSEPSISFQPTVTNLSCDSSILMEWTDIVQITGVVTGSSSYVSNFVTTGNYGLNITSGSILVYTGLNVGTENTDTWQWKPDTTSFIGNIFRLDNTSTSDYLIVGYNGNAFYRNINGIYFYNASQSLIVGKTYLIGLTSNELIINSTYA